MAAKGDDSGTNDLLSEPSHDCENASSQDTKDEPNDPWYAKLEEKDPNAEKPDVPTSDSKANGGTGRKKAVKKNENEGNGEPIKAKRAYKRKVKTEDVDGQASAVPARRGRKSSKIAPHDGVDKDSNGVKSEESQPVEKKKRGRKPKVKDGEENNKEGQDSVDNSIGNGRWSGEHRVLLADYVLSKLPQINWNEISPGLGGRNPSTVSKQWINLKKKFLELAQKMD